MTGTKTSSKDCVEMSDREFEHSELLNTVFASGCMQSDGPNVSCSSCIDAFECQCTHMMVQMLIIM